MVFACFLVGELEFPNMFWLAEEKVLLQASEECAVDGCFRNFSTACSWSYKKFELYHASFQKKASSWRQVKWQVLSRSFNCVKRHVLELSVSEKGVKMWVNESFQSWPVKSYCKKDRVVLLPCDFFKGLFHDLRFPFMIYPECLGFGSNLAA